MKRSLKRRLYWDSCCFIALFSQERTTSEKCIEALTATFEDMLEGLCKIVTSDLFYVEVLGAQGDRSVQRLQEQLSACPDFVVIGLQTRVSQLAGEFRRRCLDARPKRKLKTTDAQHLAAAELAQVDEFWTSDSKLVKYYEAGLLGKTLVCLPHGQMRMQFGG